MALNLGTLTGFLDLDSSAFDNTLGGAMDNLRDSGTKGKLIAATAGAAIGAGLAAGVLGSMNVEAANDKLAAQLGLNAAESKRLGGVAGSLYANAYGGSLEEVNVAVGAVVSSIKGMRTASASDVEAMTAKALDLATAFELDVSRAVQVVGQTVTSGLAGTAAEGMDLLTASMQAVPAAVREDLLDALDEYGPFMASIGVTGEQAFGLLVGAAEKGMYGIDKTGDALKEFTIRATDMSAASKVGYDALGMSQEKMSAQLLAGGETGKAAFEKIVTGLLGMKDPTEQSAAALALFGTPLEDLSVTEIPKFLGSLTSAQTALGDTGGAADRLGQTLNDNATVALTSLRRQAEQAVVGLANDLLPAVNDVAAAASENFAPALSAAGAVLKGVTGFLGEHQTAAKAVTGAVVALVAITQIHAAVLAVQAAGGLAAYIAQMGVVQAMTKTWTAVQWLLNAALAANPIGRVIAVVALLVAALVIAYQKSETFRDIVNGAFDAVKGGVGNAIGFMIDGFSMLLTVWLTTADGIVSGAATALGWIPGLGDKLQAANTAFDNMKDGILTTLDDAAQKAYGFGEKSGTNVADGVKSTGGKAHSAGRAVVDDVGRGVTAGGGGLRGTAFTVGANAGQGLVEGINSKQHAVAAAAQRLAITAGKAMASGLQERSPSKVTREIGMYAGEGLRLGMLDTVAGVAGAAGALAQAAIPNLGTSAPAGVRAIGGDGASSPAVHVAAPDLSDLVAEMRAMREEFKLQADRRIAYAYTEPERMPA